MIFRCIQPQLEASSKEPQKTGFLLSSAVALSVLVFRYNLDLNVNHLIALLTALKINPDIEAHRCFDYDALMTEIQDLK